MMASTITIYSYTGQSVDLVPTYSATPQTFKAYIEMKNHIVVDHAGREVMARGRIFVGTTTVIGVKDKLVLPAGYLPQTPPIISVNLADDEDGTHHVTLEIG